MAYLNRLDLNRKVKKQQTCKKRGGYIVPLTRNAKKSSNFKSDIENEISVSVSNGKFQLFDSIKVANNSSAYLNPLDLNVKLKKQQTCKKRGAYKVPAIKKVRNNIKSDIENETSVSISNGNFQSTEPVKVATDPPTCLNALDSNIKVSKEQTAKKRFKIPLVKDFYKNNDSTQNIEIERSVDTPSTNFQLFDSTPRITSVISMSNSDIKPVKELSKNKIQNQVRSNGSNTIKSLFDNSIINTETPRTLDSATTYFPSFLKVYYQNKPSLLVNSSSSSSSSSSNNFPPGRVFTIYIEKKKTRTIADDIIDLTQDDDVLPSNQAIATN